MAEKQEAQDRAELSRLGVELSRARQQKADLTRDLVALRKDIDSYTQALSKRRVDLQGEIKQLVQDAEFARAETGKAREELRGLQRERDQARSLVVRTAALRPEVTELEQRQAMLTGACAVAEQKLRTLEESCQRQSDRLDNLTQLVDAEEKAFEEAKKAVDEAVRKHAESRVQMEERQRSLAMAEETHRDRLAKLQAHEDRARQTEARLTVWERALEERERLVDVRDHQSRASLKGVADREARLVAGSEELAVAKRDFHEKSAPAFERLQGLEVELTEREQGLRDREADLANARQRFILERSQVEHLRVKLEQGTRDLQKQRDEIKRLVKQFGLEKIVGESLRG